MKSVRVASIPGEFSIYMGTPFFCPFEFFEYKHSRPFSDDKPVPLGVEWSGSVFGIIVSRTQSPQHAETAQP